MRKIIGAVVTTLTLSLAASSFAQSPARTVKIGIISDLSGLYQDIGGPGTIVAAKLAVADYNKINPNLKVEVLAGDPLNKPDIAAQIVTAWFDTGVDAAFDGPNSAVALAVAEVAKSKNKPFIISGAASSDLTGKKCNENLVHWTYDTWMLANGTGKAVVKTGGDSWFFITADYAFGHALERDTSAVVEANGGKVLGHVRVPLNTHDFSSALLQAQSSKAKIIGLANAGGDTINSIKQAAEFGIVKGGQNLAGLLVFVTDVKALGLPTAQGLVLTETWYWDLNDASRAWTKRYQQAMPGKFPTMVHAGVYASVLHYLKAIDGMKSISDGKAVVAKMKSIPTDDPLFGKGIIREDGRKIHPAYLFQVKKPEEPKYPGDFYKLRATIPANEAFRPLKDGHCSFVKS
jgi:branched-chain amino acid transport system substrate-binding protein